MRVTAHLCHPDAEAHVDDLGAVQPGHQLADLLAKHRGQRGGLRLDQHHVHAQAAPASSATSQPMKPAPMITARCAADAC